MEGKTIENEFNLIEKKEKNIARMRTINEALELIRKEDSESAITYNLIKTIVSQNKVHYFKIGKKVVLNYDDLLNVLNLV